MLCGSCPDVSSSPRFIADRRPTHWNAEGGCDKSSVPTTADTTIVLFCSSFFCTGGDSFHPLSGYPIIAQGVA